MRFIVATSIWMLFAAPATADLVSGGGVSGGVLGEPAESSFVTLENSPLFGTSASLVNLTDRIATPYPLELIDTTGWTEDTTYKETTDCTGITLSTMTALMTSDRRVVWWPKCTVTASRNIDTSSQIYQFANSNDERMFVGTRGLSKLHISPSAVDEAEDPELEWNYTEGQVARPAFDGHLFSVGSSGTPAVEESGCALASMPDIGDRTLELTDTGDCNVVTGAWGNGAIVRVRQAQIPNAGFNDPVFLFRVTCRNPPDSTGDAGSGDQTGSDCSMNPPDNGLGLSDPIPMDLSWDQYYFNGSTGDSSAVVDLVERIGTSRNWNGAAGVGTESSNVAEFIGWRDIEISRDYPGAYEAESTTSMFHLQRVMDFELSGSHLGPWGGVWVFGGTGINNNNLVGRVNVFGNHFEGPAYKAVCLAEVTAISATNPVQITVQTSSTLHSGTCTGLEGTGDRMLYFSQDAPSGNLDGLYSARPTSFVSGPGGTPRTATFTLLGTNGSGWDTTAGGFAAALDDYASAVIYWKNGVSNAQVVNNSFKNPRVLMIAQDGSSSVITAANYVRHDQNMHHSRGEFPHGNSSAPGLHAEMNDMDASIIPMASSNGSDTGSRPGEGLHRVSYKNRLLDTGPSQFPSSGSTYPDQTDRGMFGNEEDADQLNSSNEEWSFLGNLVKDANGTVDFDDVDNSGGGGAAELPYLTYQLAFFRNRCYGASCNFDDDFDSLPNPTTSTDVGVSAQSDYESDDVPANLIAERGSEPTSLFFREEPDWWDDHGAAMTFGEIGAWYDDVSGGITGLPKLPAQLRCEADGDC